MTILNKTKICEQEGCGKKMIFLFNPATGKQVPVDYDSIIPSEQKLLEFGQPLPDAEVMLCYNPVHHVSHFKTCTNPNRFSKVKK